MEQTRPYRESSAGVRHRWRIHEHYALVPNADRTAVLAVGGRLPQVTTQERRLDETLAALERVHGVRAPFLRVVRRAVDDDERLTTLFEVDATSAPGTWLALDDVDAGAVTPVFADGVEEWLAEQRGAPVPAERPEWSRPGWFAEATAWVEKQADVLGCPELVRHWALSAVYRFPTADGALYLKAVFPLFHHEPALTELVAAEFPENAPEVVAADHDRGWMLIRELPGETAREAVGRGAWWSAIAVLAQIHQAFAGRGEDVLAAGAPHRGLAQVREAIETLPGVDAIEAERLRSACDELASFGLRETLVHGDFHPGNVSGDRDRPVIFDWSDACLAHPLVDLHAVFADDEEEARSESLRRYAAAWPAHERERILAACRFAEPLACVHQALTYEALAGASEAPDRLWFVAEPPDWIERALESAARL